MKENLPLLKHLLELDDTVNKYKNTYYSTIKMKPVDVKSSSYFDFNQKSNEKDRKLVILLEDQNIKTFLQNVTLLIPLKKFL